MPLGLAQNIKLFMHSKRNLFVNCFFFVKATKLFLSSDIKNDESLIRVLAMYITAECM